MGPWGPPSSTGRRKAGDRAPLSANPRLLLQIYFVVITASLLALAAGALALQRYEAVQMAGVPTRLDRLTGELVGCVPPKGCFVIVPAGEPRLASLRELQPSSAPSPMPASPAPEPKAQEAAPSRPNK